MIPLFKVRMSEEAPDSVRKVLESGFIGQGSVVEEFEDLLQQELNTDVRPITVNSCTSAIDLALHLCGVGPDDEVISTPQTCFASQIGMLHRHATIRWADIDSETGLICAESVKKLISPNTKAIVAVNWAGRICDYKALKEFGVPVIEDAAHTWDCFLPEPLERGDYRCYSFQAIKFLTCGDGGLLITPPEQAEKARLLRWYGLDRTKNESFRCTQNIQEAGFKYHMNDIAAAIGISNLQDACASVLDHRKNAKFYCNRLCDCQAIKVLPYDPDCSYWLYSLLIQKGTKEDFIEFMKDYDITTSPVHHRNDNYACTSMFKEQDLPGVNEFYQRQVSIPVGWWLDYSQRFHIVSTIQKYDIYHRA